MVALLQASEGQRRVVQDQIIVAFVILAAHGKTFAMR